MDQPRVCKRSCELLRLSSDPEVLKRKFSGLTLLSPYDGQNAATPTNPELVEEGPTSILSNTQTQFSCQKCQQSFEDLQSMRQHFKSLEHQVQLKKIVYFRQISDDDYKELGELNDSSDEDNENEASDDSSDENDEHVPIKEGDTEVAENMTEVVNDVEPEPTVVEEENEQEDDSVSELPVVETVDSKGDQKDLYDHLLRHSKLYFRNGDQEILAVHKCLLITKKYRPNTLDELLTAAGSMHQRLRWAFLMMSGGYFAGAVFSGAKIVCHKTFRRYTTRQKQGGVQSGRDNQGGGRIRSAGAAMRRHHEASLQREIQELLMNWCGELDQCTHVFLRAPARKLGIFQMSTAASKRQQAANNANSAAVPGPVFTPADVRVRSIPITCKRPTLDEIKRVHEQLSTVEVYDKDARLGFISMSDQRQVQHRMGLGEEVPPRRNSFSQTAENASEAPKRPSPRDSKQRRRQRRQADLLTAEANASAAAGADSDSSNAAESWEETDEVRDLCTDLQAFDCDFGGRRGRGRRGKGARADDEGPQRAPAPETSASTTSWLNALYTGALCGDAMAVDRCLRQSPEDEQTTMHYLLRLHGAPGRTLLHDAVTGDCPEVVRLLLERGCSPEIVNERGKTPYETAENKHVRNAFRRFMADFPDRYDYKKAKIPSPLTEEKASEKKSKDAEKRRAQKKAKRERDRERKEAERVKEEEEKERDQFLGLSDREKRALMCERRVLADAERRGVEVPVMIRCFQCAGNLTAKNRFEYNDNVFCSSKCLQAHRSAKKK